MAEEELKNGPSEVEVPITSTPEISTAEPTPKTLTPEEEIEIKAQIEQITKRIEDRKKTIEKLNKDFEEKIKDIEQKIQEFEKEKRDNRTGEIKKLLDFFENFEVISNVPLVSQIGIPEEKLAKIATELKYKNIASMLGPVEFGTDTTISMAKKELIERLKNLIN
jgi:DNA repair exonuclease SbcCD ATPase subunit